ncbi:MAG TPA: nucleolar RNA-binding Nop10p family protein [Candidatus Nanoarchaeia archaeon]|nr:nucleolar RNA-binding Nop10p family protein [Candidatus Nanoarchaeia archaeon]
MTRHIYQCVSCRKYTLSETCSPCGTATVRPLPPKYSPQEKYADYRRKIKLPELKEKGLY